MLFFEVKIETAGSGTGMTNEIPPNWLGRRRTLGTLAALAICMGGPVVLSGQGFAQSKKGRTIRLEIRGRKVAAAKKTFRITEGEEVRIDWTTDEAVDLHLHGYDLHTKAEPGRTVSLTFKAHTAGRFPISAHNFGHATLVYLEIYPR